MTDISTTPLPASNVSPDVVWPTAATTPEKIKLFARRFVFLVYRVGDNAVEHDGIEHAGYLAWLGLLALFPFLVFVVALMGLIGESSAGLRFITLLFDNLPPHLVDVLRPRVEEILSGPPQGLMTLAFIGAIWTSSSAVEGYRTVLNRAYRVSAVPNYWYRRGMAILQLFLFSVLLIAAMLILVFVPLAQTQASTLPHNGWIADMLKPLAWMGSYGVRLGTLLVLVAIITHIHHILPNTRLKFRWILPGATLTSLGWMGVAAVFSSYLSGVNRINLIYGSLGGIIAVLVFFYVINVIFVYGAEFNFSLRAWYERREDPLLQSPSVRPVFPKTYLTRRSKIKPPPA